MPTDEEVEAKTKQLVNHLSEAFDGRLGEFLDRLADELVQLTDPDLDEDEDAEQLEATMDEARDVILARFARGLLVGRENA